MDEKELIKKTKNSLKAKKSKAEIMSNFQKRGYKLEYADKLIKKSKRPKKILVTFLIAIVLFFSLVFSVYTIFMNQEKHHITNPLSGFVFMNKISQNLQSKDIDNLEENISLSKVEYSQIEISPKLISFILNEVGVWQLHNHPITLQNPIINFKIENKEFYSRVNGEIKTYEGLSEDADIQFNTNKEDLINAIISDNPEEIFRESIISGRTQIEIKTGETDLFAKGYLKLYDSLK